MNKGLIALGIGALVGIAVVIFSEKSKKKSYHDMKASNDTETEEKIKQDKKISDRIKRAATDKVVDILGFVTKHESQIKAATLVLGFVATNLELLYRIRRLTTMGELNKKIDRLTELVKGNVLGTYFVADEVSKLKGMMA